ncbi:hypothetical protein [uncultured Winogradskyella sp.]|uniref:hypothetical protein n=1 Tax=uncultured Winogradskyella sp. TaxID=395353 RepID=UPI00260FA4FF|nr:hypothetical protein [uncultured Winogradskyella sp.]
MRFRHTTAIFFAFLFIAIVSAPTLILSIDDTADVAVFFGENEEEEKENLKLLFDITVVNEEQQSISDALKMNDSYFFKSYQKPHKNLISPPPDWIITL